jgi:hypothetical protein
LTKILFIYIRKFHIKVEEGHRVQKASYCSFFFFNTVRKIEKFRKKNQWSFLSLKEIYLRKQNIFLETYDHNMT